MRETLLSGPGQPLACSGAEEIRDPAQLPQAAASDFLPAPGRWAAGLARALLLTVSLGAASLPLWPMRETVRGAGVVRPSGENTVLQSEFGGRLRRVAVRPNQTVQRGQVLAVIEPSGLVEERRQLRLELAALERQLRQARLEQQSIAMQLQALEQLRLALVETSRRSVDQARASQLFDRRELSRYSQLLANGAVPRSLVEEKQARQLVSASEVSKALQSVHEQQARALSDRARLEQSATQSRSAADELTKQVGQRRTRLHQVEIALADGILRAPLQGSVVNTALLHPGQVIQPGQAVLTLAPLQGRLDVRLMIPTRDISPIRPGQAATLRIAACPTPEYGVMPARVLSLSQDTLPLMPAREGGPDPAAVYEVRLTPQRLALQGRQGSCRLRLGMEVTADVITRRTTVLAFLLNKLRLGGT